MLKKIYEELVAIRKELQAIRNGMESQETVYVVREPYSRNYKLVRLGSGLDGSLDAR